MGNSLFSYCWRSPPPAKQLFRRPPTSLSCTHLVLDVRPQVCEFRAMLDKGTPWQFVSVQLQILAIQNNWQQIILMSCLHLRNLPAVLRTVLGPCLVSCSAYPCQSLSKFIQGRALVLLFCALELLALRRRYDVVCQWNIPLDKKQSVLIFDFCWYCWFSGCFRLCRRCYWLALGWCSECRFVLCCTVFSWQLLQQFRFRGKWHFLQSEDTNVNGIILFWSEIVAILPWF